VFSKIKDKSIGDMIDQGFLIVEKYESLYDRYKERYNLTTARYAIPRIDLKPQDYRIQYRGIDRDCLEPNELTPRNLAEIRLSELFNQKESGYKDFYPQELWYEEDFIPVELLEEIYNYLEKDKSNYETIFVKKADISCEIPKNFKSIGYEPSFFYSDHFSASCDCMLFPRWHGTDKEGELFLNYFKQLNSFGLFDAIEIAKEFLEYYLSFDWTERGEFYITEVFLDERDIV
jgi:hypothetical protein